MMRGTLASGSKRPAAAATQGHRNKRERHEQQGAPVDAAPSGAALDEEPGEGAGQLGEPFLLQSLPVPLVGVDSDLPPGARAGLGRVTTKAGVCTLRSPPDHCLLVTAWHCTTRRPLCWPAHALPSSTSTLLPTLPLQRRRCTRAAPCLRSRPLRWRRWRGRTLLRMLCTSACCALMISLPTWVLAPRSIDILGLLGRADLACPLDQLHSPLPW